MRYHEFEPHPELSRHVLQYWMFAADGSADDGSADDGSGDDHEPFIHRVPPDGCVSLVYTLPVSNRACTVDNRAGQVHLTPPLDREVLIPVSRGAEWWGIRFWPDALASLLHVTPQSIGDMARGGGAREDDAAADSMAGKVLRGLAGVLPACSSIADACALFDSTLAALLPNSAPLDPTVRRGIECIIAGGGQTPIRDIAAELELSERQFQRRFRAVVGLTPKRFARIRRFREAASNVLRRPPEAWGVVASEHGYADQAHMTREFTALVGLAPTSFQERITQIEHRLIRP